MSTPVSEQSVSAVSYELTMVTTRLSVSSCRADVENNVFLVSLNTPVLVSLFSAELSQHRNTCKSYTDTA